MFTSVGFNAIAGQWINIHSLFRRLYSRSWQDWQMSPCVQFVDIDCTQKNAIIVLADCQCIVCHCSIEKETVQLPSVEKNTQGTTLIRGWRVRDSPRGLWPVDRLQPFCWNLGWEKSHPSSLNSHYMKQKVEKKQTGWFMCPLCGQSLSSETHTQTRTSRSSDTYTFFHIDTCTNLLYVGVYTGVHGHRHIIIVQRKVDWKCLRSMSFLANLHD